MSLDYESLAKVNELLTKSLDNQRRKATMRGFASKMMESFQRDSAKLIEELGLNSELEEPKLPSLEESLERGKKHHDEHLALLRSQTAALKNWRDSL